MVCTPVADENAVPGSSMSAPHHCLRPDSADEGESAGELQPVAGVAFPDLAVIASSSSAPVKVSQVA